MAQLLPASQSPPDLPFPGATVGILMMREMLIFHLDHTVERTPQPQL